MLNFKIDVIQNNSIIICEYIENIIADIKHTKPRYALLVGNVSILIVSFEITFWCNMNPLYKIQFSSSELNYTSSIFDSSIHNKIDRFIDSIIRKHKINLLLNEKF